MQEQLQQRPGRRLQLGARPSAKHPSQPLLRDVSGCVRRAAPPQALLRSAVGRRPARERESPRRESARHIWRQAICARGRIAALAHTLHARQWVSPARAIPANRGSLWRALPLALGPEACSVCTSRWRLALSPCRLDCGLRAEMRGHTATNAIAAGAQPESAAWQCGWVVAWAGKSALAVSSRTFGSVVNFRIPGATLTVGAPPPRQAPPRARFGRRAAHAAARRFPAGLAPGRAGHESPRCLARASLVL